MLSFRLLRAQALSHPPLLVFSLILSLYPEAQSQDAVKHPHNSADLFNGLISSQDQRRNLLSAIVLLPDSQESCWSSSLEVIGAVVNSLARAPVGCRSSSQSQCIRITISEEDCMTREEKLLLHRMLEESSALCISFLISIGDLAPRATPPPVTALLDSSLLQVDWKGVNGDCLRDSRHKEYTSKVEVIFATSDGK